MTIGERLKELRVLHKKTQKEVADAINASRGNFSAYESNKINPAANTIVALAEYFNVSCDFLLTGKQNNITDSLIAESNVPYLSEDEECLISSFRKLPLKKQMRFLGRIEEAVEMYPEKKTTASDHHNGEET